MFIKMSNAFLLWNLVTFVCLSQIRMNQIAIFPRKFTEIKKFQNDYFKSRLIKALWDFK